VLPPGARIEPAWPAARSPPFRGAELAGAQPPSKRTAHNPHTSALRMTVQWLAKKPSGQAKVHQTCALM
jgi:hypothetical protein